MTEPSAEDVRKNSMAVLASAHTVYVETTRDCCGEAGLEAIAVANVEHGRELGEEGVAQGGLRRGDLKSIYEFFVAGYPYFGFEVEIGELTDKRLDLKVTSCPWIDTFRAKGASEDICYWVTKIDEGIGHAVDQDLKMTLPMCMMRGDEYCIYRYER
ncbi:MAG: L-2-amino-thiazoline-4-carboxylic acid hydrolase [Candidatus Thorarchaeota archaeon]